MSQITDQQALQRVIEHREIFHDEMLGLMREQEGLPEHCLYIGDTPGDREASQAQRMDFWGVSWGYGLTREESRLHHPSELPQALGAAQA